MGEGDGDGNATLDGGSPSDAAAASDAGDAEAAILASLSVLGQDYRSRRPEQRSRAHAPYRSEYADTDGDGIADGVEVGGTAQSRARFRWRRVHRCARKSLPGQAIATVPRRVRRGDRRRFSAREHACDAGGDRQRRQRRNDVRGTTRGSRGGARAGGHGYGLLVPLDRAQRAGSRWQAFGVRALRAVR